MTPSSIKYSFGIWIFLILAGFASAINNIADAEGWEIAIPLGVTIVNTILVLFCAARRQWARVLLAISVVIGILFVVVQLPETLSLPFATTIVVVGSNALAALATWLMFTPDSTYWFTTQPQNEEEIEEEQKVNQEEERNKTARRRRRYRVGAVFLAISIVAGGAYWQFGGALTNWDPILERCLGPTESMYQARQERVAACTRLIESNWFSDVERAEFLMARGHAQNARADRRRDYLSATEADSGNADAWRLVGESYLGRQGDRAVEQSVAALRQAVDLAPDNLEVRGLLGRALARAGQMAQAVPELQSGLQVQPNSADLAFALFRAQRQLGNLEDALHQLEAFLLAEDVDDEDVAIARTTRAALLLELGRLDEGQVAAEDLYREQVQDITVPLLVVLSQCARGDSDATWRSVERVIDDGWLAPNDWRHLLVQWGAITRGAAVPSEDGIMTRPIARAVVGWIEAGCPQPLITLPEAEAVQEPTGPQP